MLKLTALAATLVTATAMAQSPLLSGNTPNNQGNIGGGVYFDLITGPNQITITDLAWIPAAVGATGGGMDIWMGPVTWVGNTTNNSAWTLVTSTAGAGVLTGGQMTAPDPLANPICLEANSSYGIALVATAGTSGFSHNYANGTVGCPITTTPGGNQVAMTAELTFEGGAAQNAFLTGGLFCPRVWQGEIHYTVGPCSPIQVASKTKYGTACYKLRSGYEELFPNTATGLDVAGATIEHAFNGAVYTVTTTTNNPYSGAGPTAVSLPLATNTDTASVATALGGALPFPILFPNQNAPGGVGIADDLEVCSSGYITPVDVSGAGTTAPAPGSNPGDLTPTLDEFYNVGSARWAPMWQNQTPPNGTEITAEITGNGTLLITWAAVEVTGVAASTNTYQVEFFASGDVHYRYDASHTGFGGGGWPTIIGLTQGSGSLENPVDVSGLAGVVTDPNDNAELDLDMDSRPVLGSSPNLVISGFDAATTAAGFLLFDFAPDVPGTNLNVFGAPGCFGNVPITGVSRLFLTGGTAPYMEPFINGGVPNNAGLNGLNVYIQAAALQPGFNALGLTSSNGLDANFGSL